MVAVSFALILQSFRLNDLILAEMKFSAASFPLFSDLAAVGLVSGRKRKRNE
jgi:hypothetical protein